ncbi:MAG TPA: valine--tRNA ligase [Anaerolineales bacterium]
MMALSKHYDPKEAEPRWQAWWQAAGVYRYSPQAGTKVFSIDTPPPTVSGHLHLGHVYSYSHTDFIARFRRMQGDNVFYPMGYDDNGLPTERLVEKRLGITAPQVGREPFIQKCLEVSEAAEKDYQNLWQRLGLSIDWRYTYRTIDANSRRTSQLSFIDLYRQGRAYRREAPAIWCPECRTAIAQADLNDLVRPSEFVTLPFRLENGDDLLVATTRPELLPACVAVFVYPEDRRYRGLAGKMVRVPFFGQDVPVLEDPGADPDKGSGAVMCCTFGDAADVAWWYTHNLPLIQAIGRDGRMTPAAGVLSGLAVGEARRQIKQALEAEGLILSRQPTTQSVRVHERCDTPIEYVIANQWFIKVLDQKETFLNTGTQITWHPEHMQARYQAWVENLNWDWCISRQRYFGVPFPVWHCRDCDKVILAQEEELPVDPSERQPSQPCPNCGGNTFTPEEDVMDTWATSSLSPQIVGRWLAEPDLYRQVFPFSLRPQAHEIIRTWAFYTIVKSQDHFQTLPWKDVLISGWGLAGEGMGKLSKSRGGGPLPPVEMIERYSADAVRYWAASTGPGRDSVISEEKIQMGAKLVTKLWNVARFSERFLNGYTPPELQPNLPSVMDPTAPALTPADRWILSRLQHLVSKVTNLFEGYDYAAAKNETEAFFWRDLADNYLEMCKQRLYDEAHPQREAARFALYHLLQTLLKLFAPILPYVTEEIYQGLFAARPASSMEKTSIHRLSWPQPDKRLEDHAAEAAGETLVEIATAVRRFKSEHSLPLSAELEGLKLACDQTELATLLRESESDLKSITRANRVQVVNEVEPGDKPLPAEGKVRIVLK